MHSAVLSKSPRLLRVLRVLNNGRKRTTRQIMRLAHVCAVNSCVSELRDNGIIVNCERKGAKWFYWMP